MNRADAVSGFQHVFGRPPLLVTRAPGRVNLIGEHTDYNDGFVFPAAIEFATWTALAPRPDRVLIVHAGNRGERVTIDLDSPGTPLQRHWSDYVRGMAVELGDDGHRLQGADIWFAGNVPDGAGLSSSAALEMSVGLALLANASPAGTPAPLDLARLALAGQRAEHHYAGTKCGIMDQFISAHARTGHALLLDCRSLACRHVAIPADLRLVICDSGVKHELAGGEYNVRRSQCEQGVTHLRRALPHIRALRDVSPDQLREFGRDLPDLVRRRCAHVVAENQRVETFAESLVRDDAAALGRLMADSHASLRDDYEVSCPELDALVDIAGAAPGIVGARMTGGGFGGSTINLVRSDQVEAFQEHAKARFLDLYQRPLRIFASSAANGAEILP